MRSGGNRLKNARISGTQNITKRGSLCQANEWKTAPYPGGANREWRGPARRESIGYAIPKFNLSILMRSIPARVVEVLYGFGDFGAVSWMSNFRYMYFI